MPPSLLTTAYSHDNARATGTRVISLLTMPSSTAQRRRRAPSREWLLELATTLQTTLDVDTLIGLFATRVGGLVRHDSVEFRASRDEVQTVVGSGGEHRCTYDLVLGEHHFGTLAFARDEAFSPEETAVLEDLLANLVYPLRNALMYREALEAAARDPLTGVQNRSGLRTTLEREVELARRHRVPLSVIMVDADRFKSINDTHGHVAGDAVLKSLADCIRRCSRDSDIVFRFGGEEFCVVLSNTALDGAVRLAERLRKAVASLPIRLNGTELRATVSVGVAALGPRQSGETLLRKADAALYHAKGLGRNRVVSEAQLA